MSKEEIAKGAKRPREACYEELYPATADPRGFFESVLGFEKLEGRWFRVKAADQRRYFGNTPFGKKAVKVTGEGSKVEVFRTSAFGKDWEFWEIYYDFSSKEWRWISDESPIPGEVLKRA